MDRVLYYRVGPSGLGHVLTSILNAAAWAMAERRALAIDATGSIYFPADAHAQFFATFALHAPPGLTVITDPARLAALRQDPDRHEIQLTQQVAQAERSPARVVEVNGAMLADQYPIGDRAGRPDLRISLRGRVADSVATRIAALRAKGPVIGIYLRHGNGEYLNGRFDARSLPDLEARLAALEDRYCETAARFAADRGWSAPRHFIASDNAGFVARLRDRLPNAMSFAARLPDRSFAEHLSVEGRDPAILEEAIQDVWCLAACDGLIYSKSLFAHFAMLNSTTLSADSMIDIQPPTLLAAMGSAPPDQAVEMARAAYAAMPGRRNAAALAIALEGIGEKAGAARLRQQSRWELTARGSPGFREARDDARAGRFQSAIERLRTIEQAIGDNPFVMEMLARFLARVGQRDAALAIIARAAALDAEIPQVAGTYTNLWKAPPRARDGASPPAPSPAS